MFESASKIVITGGSFIGAQNNAGTVDDKADQNTKLVESNVSWNAILNSEGRADAVRCYPGTRKTVIAHIEAWIRAEDNAEKRIFWLCGPAGAGKSAIAQSIAERCLDHGIPMANFFFFRADTTRNQAAPLVPTLLYQLFDVCPVIKWRVHNFITQNNFIFDKSVEKQLKTLMLSASIHPGQTWSGRQKIVLILDGLDECSSDKLDTTQQDIIRALHHIVTHKDSPFILFVSCRAEPHLIRTFNAFQPQVARLYLDGDDFSSSDDIKYFVIGQFKEIKETHHLSWTLNEDWPSTDDIESIVHKSSGHFIYAATVMRFIKTSPGSPVLNLERVEGIRTVESDSPFSQLDAVYAHILAKARNWPKARDILAAQILPDAQDATILPKSSRMGVMPLAKTSYILDALGYNLHEISSYTAELTALVEVGEFGEVKFHHTSLGDFLLDEERSCDFFIDMDEFRLKLVIALFHCIAGNLSWSLIVEHFTRLKTTSDAMTEALSSSRLFSSRLAFSGATLYAFLAKIKEFYFEANADLYTSILEKWLTWFHKNRGTLQENELDGIQHAGKIWNQIIETSALISGITTEEDNGRDQEVTPLSGLSFMSEAESPINEDEMETTDLLKQLIQSRIIDMEARKTGKLNIARRFHDLQVYMSRKPDMGPFNQQAPLQYQGEEQVQKAVRREGQRREAGIEQQQEELKRREEELERREEDLELREEALRREGKLLRREERLLRLQEKLLRQEEKMFREKRSHRRN
ncbi:hypothetical protein D9619_010634 [Psilocybe cf. subviscida]|uniref:NACHT domain-containing protein n=1 Tax=Psilocybe cf. subviscida TaxID=2480587 RepID=A0A8H5B8Z6_9AGAR|nr:hypothetical protein D9619_010634 [Psilocybe cf. subviscida]